MCSHLPVGANQAGYEHFRTPNSPRIVPYFTAIPKEPKNQLV